MPDAVVLNYAMDIINPEYSPVKDIVPTFPRLISHSDYSKHIYVLLKSECGNTPIRHIQVPRIVLLKREIDILKTVDHPTLIRLEDVYEDGVNLHLVSQISYSDGTLYLMRINSTRGNRLGVLHSSCSLVPLCIMGVFMEHSRCCRQNPIMPFHRFLFRRRIDVPLTVV